MGAVMACLLASLVACLMDELLAWLSFCVITDSILSKVFEMVFITFLLDFNRVLAYK